MPPHALPPPRLLQDNSTFIHLPYWSDDRTTAISVGLLQEVPGLEPVQLAGDRPPAGRNFVLAADFKTLPTALQTSAGVRTAVPFLLYLASHVSLTPGALGMPILPVNRPLIVVGKLDPTSIDLGMAVNTLQLGPQGSVLFNQVVLENLAPGDARSVALAGPFDPMLAYPVWAVAFDRCAAGWSVETAAPGRPCGTAAAVALRPASAAVPVAS